MKVYESIDIAALPLEVWAHLADPRRMAAWHAKLVEVRRSSAGPLYVGERFGATYVMNPAQGRRLDSETEVLQCEPATTLVFRHLIRHVGRTRYVDETFQLSPREGGTHVDHAVDLSHSGLPLWARALMWCITRTGEPRGEGILEPLKRVCEREATG